MQEILQFLIDQWILSMVVIALIALLIYGEKPKNYKILDINEIINVLDSGDALIIDVREEKEIKNKIKSAINIPLSNLKNKINDLDKNKKVVAYCQNGMRSKSAANLLAKNKFTNIYTINGGFDAWVRTGLPVEK